MGYLQITDGIPDFSKAVFAFMFRVPAASMAAAQAQYLALSVDDAITATHDDPDNPVIWENNLMGIIPFVTWGPNPTASNTFWVGSTKVSPCFIGLNCGPYRIGSPPNPPQDTPNLAVHLVYSGQDFTDANNTIPNDFTIGYSSYGETFWPGVPWNGFDPDIRMEVLADTWYHAIVSFDLDHSGDPSVDPCQCWISLSDVNKDGLNLWPAFAGSPNYAGGPNAISQTDVCIGKANGALQASEYPLAIPCTSENVDFVYKVEMARLQIFTGVTLDTSVESNRRAFVTAGGTPANVSLARALLGQVPDVEFVTAADWIAGNNTGSAGNFTRTGTVTAFTSPVPDISP